MSEKQIDRVQTIAMWVIGGLMAFLLVIMSAFTNYVVTKQDERIANLEHKYQSLIESNSAKISSIEKNVAVIAAKMNVDLKQ